ncbi:MAG: HAD-IIIA family hydrolase [Chthoniobacteraceae bacterium]|jgi:D-glycero-D-manno-heptose 1,7-bisphosphate phosphatase
MKGPYPAVFFDRDGTLIRDAHYANDPLKVEMFPEVPGALRRLKDAGFRVVIITNQSGFARGLVTQEQYDSVQARLMELAGPGIIDATYMCPDFGPRRKPSPEMILEAVLDLNLDPGRSCMVGDKAIDIQCGRNAGTKTVFVRTGYALDAGCEPDFIAANMAEAADWILQEL